MSILKKDLNTALHHIRVLQAAGYETSIKLALVDLREEVTDLIKLETDRKEKLFQEKKEIIMKAIRKEVDKMEDGHEKKTGGKLKNKEAVVDAFATDNLDLAEVNKNRASFWSSAVMNSIPFVLLPGLEALPGKADLVTSADGETMKVPISDSFEWLVEKGFIHTKKVSKTKQEKDEQTA